MSFSPPNQSGRSTPPRGPNQPSPIDEVLNNIPGGAKAPLILLAIFCMGVLAFKSFYTVPANSEGVVLRFGRFYGKVGSGLRFKVPIVDEVIILPTKRQLK
jgi:membrane protease subunit HflK